jgi:hypothetical protein
MPTTSVIATSIPVGALDHQDPFVVDDYQRVEVNW